MENKWVIQTEQRIDKGIKRLYFKLCPQKVSGPLDDFLTDGLQILGPGTPNGGGLGAEVKSTQEEMSWSNGEELKNLKSK